jgi:hypothetical protein
MSPSVETALLRIFLSTVNGVVGHEANYQANLYHQLVRRYGAPCVAREFRVDGAGRGGIDVVVVDPVTRGLRIAFEIKGGAYGNRNALNDTISAAGYCPDMDKLATLRKQGIESWFICVDATELGRSLDATRLSAVQHECAARGIGFAYHAHDDVEALIQTPEGGVFRPPLARSRDGQQVHLGLFQPCGRFLFHLASALERTNPSEADIVGLLYHGMMLTGHAATQVSLETYLNLATPEGGVMQLRPDMCLFDPGVQGRFNLYARGVPSQSNDAHKLAHLRLLLEAKGGRSLVKKSNNALTAIYLSDVQKLSAWRMKLRRSPWAREDVQYRFAFLGVDNRYEPLPPRSLSELHCEAETLNVDFLYLHAPAETVGRGAVISRA